MNQKSEDSDTSQLQAEHPEHAGSSDESSRQHDDRIFGSNAPPRNLRLLEIAAAAYNICNTWLGVAATMYVGFLAGGSATIIYGIIVVEIFVGCGGLSLAELAARYPSAGGQYHWVWIMSSEKTRRATSYIAAVVNIFSWLAISASVCVIIPNFLAGLAALKYGFVAHQWQLFLIYQAINLIVLLYNLFVLAHAPWTHNIGFALTLLCMLTFWITCLARASPKAASSYVWTSFVNEGLGWPDGVIFLTGMSNPNYMYAGIDGALHLAEDALNASTVVPRALACILVIGFITAFTFIVSMFYCISDPVAVAESPIPIYEIFAQATRSYTAATIMLSLGIVIGFFSLNACVQTSSRLTWSFGRDHGLVFSKYIGKIHPTLKVPVWALFFNAFVIFVIGCVYLGNTIAFNAVVGCSLILQHISIAIPIVILMASGRNAKYLPARGSWNLGPFGWVLNAGAVAWAVIVTIFYCFPTAIPTTSSTMNYACVVLAVMFLFGVLNWFVYARKRYQGPRVDLTALAEAHAVKM